MEVEIACGGVIEPGDPRFDEYQERIKAKCEEGWMENRSPITRMFVTVGGHQKEVLLQGGDVWKWTL